MSDVAAAILRRHRTVTAAALAMLALLAWWWILSGAGMGMPARAEILAFPHRGGGMNMAVGWDAPRFALNLAMWWVMMIAMMIPAAAPVILLYGRAAPAQDIAPHDGVFVAGYLLSWLGFSALAVALQLLLESIGILNGMTMSLTSRWLAGAVLIAAGIYQLTPAKDACLSHCRSPADFLARNFRPGAFGALRMGHVHGAYCVGCCWLLMALLFVGGIMNLAWIALLTILVAAEKLLPHGRWLARGAGLLFLAWGGLIVFVG